MAWLKKNLILIVSGVVALALMGLAGFYLVAKLKDADEIHQKFSAQHKEFQRLVNRKVFPNSSNIDMAREDLVRVEKVHEEIQSFFAPITIPKPLNNAIFKQYLEQTIFQMEQKAQISGVDLPDNFHFTFDVQRPMVVFAQGSLEPLAMQISEIKSLTDILFDGKIHSLISLRRAPVSEDDTSGQPQYLNASLRTNSVTQAVISPYDATFQCFSSELAEVLEGFAQSDHCWIVKAVDVQPGGSDPGVLDQMSPSSGMDADMMRRYGLGPGGEPGRGGEGRSRYGGATTDAGRYGASPYGGAGGRYGGSPYGGAGGRYGGSPYGGRYQGGGYPMAPNYQPRPRSGGLDVALDENPLLVTLKLEIIRLKPKTQPANPNP